MHDDPGLKITARSAPFHGDPPYAPAFYEATGRIVILWGRFEQHLDFALLIAINIARHHGIDEPMMVSLKRKTRLMKSLFKRCEPFKHLAPSVGKLMSDIEAVGDGRNALIHSNNDGFEKGEPPRLVLRNIKHRNDEVIFSTIKVSLDQIQQLADDIDKLNTRMVGLTFFLVQKQPPRKVQTAPQQD